MAPSWVISRTRNVVAKLIPDHTNRRYNIEIVSGVSAAEMSEAEQGTVRDGRLGAILWAAGLRVTAAWNIVTETDSALKEGNYVQGTVSLVLRKRVSESNARRMEIESEIEDAVRAQLDRLNALDEDWVGETLYTDGDLTLAA